MEELVSLVPGVVEVEEEVFAFPLIENTGEELIVPRGLS